MIVLECESAELETIGSQIEGSKSSGILWYTGIGRLTLLSESLPETWMELPTSFPTTIPQVTSPFPYGVTKHPDAGYEVATSLAHITIPLTQS